jgi:hypothetical protein
MDARKITLRLTGFLLITGTLFGCGNLFHSGGGGSNSTVDSDFHPGIPNTSTDTSTTTVISTTAAFGSFGGIKLSPGQVSAAGNSTAAAAAITPTVRKVSGSTVGASLSINLYQAR